MKKIVAFITTTVAATSLTFAQGTVNFTTFNSGPGARVLEAAGASGAGLAIGNTAGGGTTGAQFLMQLFAAAGTVADSASLQAVGVPVNSRSGGNAGYSQVSGTTTLGATVNAEVLIGFLTPGGPCTLQLRAWWAGSTGNTYVDWATGSTTDAGRSGASPLYTLGATGNPTLSPPGTPVDLTGLQGFALTPNAIPEPSSMALAGLGAASLLIFRRRK